MDAWKRRTGVLREVRVENDSQDLARGNTRLVESRAIFKMTHYREPFLTKKSESQLISIFWEFLNTLLMHLRPACDIQRNAGDIIRLSEKDDRLADIRRRLLAPQENPLIHHFVEDAFRIDPA